MCAVIVPGSFDPPTNGHYNLMDRASKLYHKLYVVIASNPGKTYTFTAEERQEMMEELLSLSNISNVEVIVWDRLIVEFAATHDVWVMIRGLRSEADFSYELELSIMNRGLDARIETIFFPTYPELSVLRSSSVKELVRLGGDVTKMVPPSIVPWLVRKIGLQKKRT